MRLFRKDSMRGTSPHSSPSSTNGAPSAAHGSHAIGSFKAPLSAGPCRRPCQRPRGLGQRALDPGQLHPHRRASSATFSEQYPGRVQWGLSLLLLAALSGSFPLLTSALNTTVEVAGTSACPDGLPIERPMMISKGGVGGQFALYTIDAYKAALAEGARTLECKVGITSDGHAVCTPGLNLEYVSDVQRYHLDKFAHKYSVHLRLNPREPLQNGWFLFNFTLAEIMSIQVVRDVRHPRTVVNGRRSREWRLSWSRLATVRELFELTTSWVSSGVASQVQEGANTVADRNIRLFLEPLYAEFMWDEYQIGSDRLLLDLMVEFQLVPNQVPSPPPSPPSPPLAPGQQPELTQRVPGRVAVHIQSREAKLLRFLREATADLPLVLVLDWDWDLPDASFPVLDQEGNKDEWRERVWDDIATYSWAVAVNKDILLPRTRFNFLDKPLPARTASPGGVQHQRLPMGPVLAAARARNLTVLAWDFCVNDPFGMAYDFSRDIYAEHAAFIEGVGVDGFVTECPATSQRYLESRLCMELLQSGEPITIAQLGWTELLLIATLVFVAILPMGVGLMYAVYKWRESEQYLLWQDFATGLYSADSRAGSSRVARAADAGLMLAAMGGGGREGENVPLTEAEWSPTGNPRPSAFRAGAKSKDEESEDSGLLPGEDRSGAKQKTTSSGTWRMRRGAEWNSEDNWK